MLPALPLDEAGKYVAAAYLVFLALILIYVAIMAGRLARDRARPRRGAGRCSSAGRPKPTSGRRSRDERAARRSGASHKTRRAGRARAAGAARRAGRAVPARAGRAAGRHRGRRGLDLQPHRALRRRRRSGGGRGRAARGAGGRGPDRRPVRRAQLRRRAPPVPRGVRAGVDDRRRGRDPGPGQARLRAGAGRAHDRPADQPALPRGAGDRQAGADGDRRLRGPRLGGDRRRRCRARRRRRPARRATS